MFSGLLAVLLQIPSPAVSMPPQTPQPQSLRAIQVEAPHALLHLQVASTEAQRELGLMSVTKLQPHDGMLFVFETDAPVAFWMKDTLLPLDMVFVGSDGRVRTVAANVPAVPLDEPNDKIPRRNGAAKYVIELAAGEAHKDGIAPGVMLAGLPESPA
ncbi:MAG: DUF192 domain-containing protein [Candidatus Eremiobacteraeota bacterium]|nr:DUF192 domain-containing protein [Candidatus Eremiobacteraeota bacterium]